MRRSRTVGGAFLIRADRDSPSRYSHDDVGGSVGHFAVVEASDDARMRDDVDRACPLKNRVTTFLSFENCGLSTLTATRRPIVSCTASNTLHAAVANLAGDFVMSNELTDRRCLVWKPTPLYPAS